MTVDLPPSLTSYEALSNSAGGPVMLITSLSGPSGVHSLMQEEERYRTSHSVLPNGFVYASFGFALHASTDRSSAGLFFGVNRHWFQS